MISTIRIEALPPVDIVRFLGSIDLLTRERSWTKARDPLFDRFFDGYRHGFAGGGIFEPTVSSPFQA
jgi:hypothetical protein